MAASCCECRIGAGIRLGDVVCQRAWSSADDARYRYVGEGANRDIAPVAGHAATEERSPLNFDSGGCHRCAKSLTPVVNSATMRPFGEPHGLFAHFIRDLRPATFRSSCLTLFRTDAALTSCR